MNEKLKLCPFCGGEGDVCVANWDFTNNKPPENPRYGVKCKECLSSTNNYETRNEAVKWCYTKKVDSKKRKMV